MDNTCFVCAESCDSYFYLINAASKKFKTKYISLITDFISPEYELRVTNENKICERCSVLIEKYDELQHESRTVRSVLGRQIAHTYNIETNEPVVYMDKSKIFVELGPNQHSNIVKYSCKLCPRYVTDNIETVNSHVVYHNILMEGQIQKNEALKGSPQKRNPPIRRETTKKPPVVKAESPQHVSVTQEVMIKEEHVVPMSNAVDLNFQQDFDEETLDSLIDLNIVTDPRSDSNLNHGTTCMVTGCLQEFTFVSDYVRHLKLKHRTTINHIFAAVRANIKRPTKVSKLMCPYCFAKTSSTQSLEEHVKQHEHAGKSIHFNERITEFINISMSLSRCKTCDCEILDPTLLECDHQIVRSGLAPKTQCMYCSQEFYSDKLHNTHLALEHDHCFICGLTCADKSVLVEHIRSHMSHAEYSCMFCKDIYQTKPDRLEHLKLKHSDHCCTYCDEWFEDKTELTHHIRYAHADKKMESKHSVCDSCGASFKNKMLYNAHQQREHTKRKIYTCSACKESFRFRYVLMDHIRQIHQRTIVDSDTNFYKCFVCTQGFSSQNRKQFISHLNEHKKTPSFCSDCNANLESAHQYEAHRERSHQDFSLLVDKKPVKAAPEPSKVPKAQPKTVPKSVSKSQTVTRTESYQQSQELPQVVDETEQFSVLQDESQQAQQIMVQTEDGSLLNMNNFILTESGELLSLEGLLPNGSQESVDDTSTGGQIHIGNLEQFLMEQGLSGSTEISYIQPDEGQVIIQNDDGTVSQSSQESLMQTYKEIFEPDDIPTELMASSEVPEGSPSQSILLNGDFMVQAMPSLEQPNGQVVEVQSTSQVDANQSTLDELGDILLEVAAAAEKEKKPKIIAQKTIRESLWGSRKRPADTVNNGSAKKRPNAGRPQETLFTEAEQPASNFSQAYEFFVKGFDAKKQKQP